MADTTTTLNPGSGGDKMDETLAVQGDGETSAKRPRVELAIADEGVEPRLVGRSHPLPVDMTETNNLLRQLVDIGNVIIMLLDS